MNKEIIWNLINSLLAGFLVLFGSLAAIQTITLESFIAALLAFAITAIVQFKNFWDAEKPEYCPKLFSFIKL